jgi:hypothetical protein
VLALSDPDRNLWMGAPRRNHRRFQPAKTPMVGRSGSASEQPPKSPPARNLPAHISIDGGMVLTLNLPMLPSNAPSSEADPKSLCVEKEKLRPQPQLYRLLPDRSAVDPARHGLLLFLRDFMRRALSWQVRVQNDIDPFSG